MGHSYHFVLEIAIILIAAMVGGLVSERLKQPAVLGQILAGLVLGAGILKTSEISSSFAQIGVILLMFIAGLETDVQELVRSARSSSLIALGGVVAPALLVFFAMLILAPESGVNAPIVMAIITTATSVSISVQTLREMNQLRSLQGTMILGAAIIDDVIGILLLTVMVSVVRPGSGSSIGTVLLDLLIFTAIIVAVGFVAVRLIAWLENRFDIEAKLIVVALALCLALAFLSEHYGIAGITGAYFAGVIMSMTSFRHRLSHEMGRISGMMFTPIFFVSIGMSIDLKAAWQALGIGLVLFALGSIGKIVGCGFGARVSGFSMRESLQIGVGMIPRAEVALIIANLGVQMGLLSSEHLAATVLLVLASTLATPVLLKKAFDTARV